MIRPVWFFSLVSLLAPLSLQAQGPKVEITSELEEPLTGRIVVVFGPEGDPSPVRHIGQTGMTTPLMAGVDASSLTRGKSVALPLENPMFPAGVVGKLPPGKYSVQAAIQKNPDLKIFSAPGNVISPVVSWQYDPAQPKPLALALKTKLEDRLPPETDLVKWVLFKSEKLSQFFGRDMYHRAAVVLPPQFAKQPEARFPLMIRIGGFGTRFTSARSLGNPRSEFQRTMAEPDAKPLVILHLDGAGPWGDPYHVNSANNGPMGDALIGELIPEVEKRFRCGGKPSWRFTEGHSTGGWVSLALQVFYPDFFGGCWSHDPDPVDFRDFEVLNIYEEPNAYVNRFGFERPAMRTTSGDIQYTLRHEVLVERIIGPGGRWELGGKDWSSWNAVFGPKGTDGYPVPLWDGESGKMNRQVAEHWRKYDLRHHLESNWATIGPKLKGKIRVYSGDADEYFLNNAVHRLDRFLKSAKPLAEARIVFGPNQGHGFRGHTDAAMFKEMAQLAAMDP